MYVKPKVVSIGPAGDAIQGQTFKSVAPADHMPSDSISSANAYEADE